MTRLTTCADAETVAQRAAMHVEAALARAQAERGRAHLALSGGTTPGRTFELLAQRPERLGETELWFADERCVGPDDQQSNFRLARETGLVGGAVALERVHRMEGELGPQQGAERYAALLEERLGAGGGNGGGEGEADVPVLDLVILGIGPDGHVASLFPDSAALQATEQAVCLPITDSPKPPPERITLSLPVLLAARGCLLLATGSGKAEAVDAMLGEPTAHVPASLLRRERLTVMLDDDAAPGGQRR
jgi:6-phosphogluconolactonase